MKPQPSYEWHQEPTKRTKPRNPWHGLTPEDAYRKGHKDGEAHERNQQRLRDEFHPDRRPRMGGRT